MDSKPSTKSFYWLGRHSQRHLRRIAYSVALLAILAGPAANPALGDASEPGLDSATALATFDQVWEQVRDQYFDFERIESDWELARDQLRPRAAETTDIATLRALLHELLELIGESHFGIFPLEAFEQLANLDESADPDQARTSQGSQRASTGLSVRLIDDAVRVTEARTGTPADKAGIRPGWTLLSVDDFELDPAVKEISGVADEGDRRRSATLLDLGLDANLRFPRPDREIALTFLDNQGVQRQLDLSGAPLEHAAVQIGNLPPMTFEFSLEQVETPRGCVSVVTFSSWVPVLIEEFRQRREQIFSCVGLVLDLRGNPGGVLPTMVMLAADLFDQPAVLGSLLRRDGQLDFRVMPRQVDLDGTRLNPYSGPVAILVDGISGSTSEMFAAGMQATERARIFGQRSAGMALPAQMLPLASGDFLMYAFADYRDSLDRRIEGVGVKPDHPIELTPENLDDRPPPALRASLGWIAEQVQ